MSGPDSVHPNRTYCSYSSLMGSDWELNFICCESNPLKCPVVSLIVIDAIVILGAIELYWSPILAFTFHLCFSAAKIRLEVTELCSVQIFQLRVAFCALFWMDLEFPSCQKKSSMSHSSSVHEEESGYDGPPLCVYSHHICCSLSLFGRNESKCYLHNLPSCYLQIYDVSITWNNCLMWLQSFVLCTSFWYTGAHGKIPPLCLTGRKLSCWWRRKWVMMEASFDVNLSWVMSTTGSQR